MSEATNPSSDSAADPPAQPPPVSQSTEPVSAPPSGTDPVVGQHPGEIGLGFETRGQHPGEIQMQSLIEARRPHRRSDEHE